MNKKILVVEDDDINLIIVEHILNKVGFDVTKATNGKEAIDEVSKEAFALILMDVEMPIMGGVEATPHIRKLMYGKEVPIIALTAHSMSEKFKEIEDAGMNDYVIKPFDLPKAERLIQKYLNPEYSHSDL